MIPDEREWHAQEKAMRCERAYLELPVPDALVAAYLPIARALSQPLEPSLPADFAARMASMVATRQHLQEADSKLERWLLVGLATVFGICTLAAVVIYGSSWLDNSFGMLAQAGTTNLAWSAALAACLAVSWFSETLRRRVSDHGQSVA